MKHNAPLSALTLAGLLAAAASPIHAQNVLQNGSFETGDFAGWNVNSPDSSLLVDSAAGPYGIYSAQSDDGGRYYALFPSSTISSLDQAFSTTAGSLYEINFYVNDNFGGSALQVSASGATLVSAGVGGSTLLNFTTANDSTLVGQGWQNFDFWVQANGSSVDLTFFGSTSSFMGVDKVSVVPEPSTFALAGLGAVGLLSWRQRRAANA